ncbi:hypothetical protein VIGAN_06193300, partial [Vigna angularis var. angularis]
RHLEKSGTGVHYRVIGFGSIRNHESLLKRRQSIPQVLRNPRDSSPVLPPVVGGLAGAPNGVSGVPPRLTGHLRARLLPAGGPNRHSLRLPGFRVRLQHQTPFRSALRGISDLRRRLTEHRGECL